MLAVMFVGAFALANTANAASCASFSMTFLKKGMKNSEVKCLQEMLNEKGYNVDGTGAGSAGKETTYFGNATLAAVKTFQAANSLVADGIFGAKSRAALVAAGTVVANPATPGSLCPNGMTLASNCSMAPNGTTVPVTGMVTVALSSSNPASAVVATKTANNPVLALSIANGTTGSVNITGLNLTKTGYYANTNISGVSVYDGSGVRHGNVVTSLGANGVATMTFVTDPIVVAAGTTQTVWVKVNLSGTDTGTVGFNVNSATDVMVSGGTVTSSFPIVGNQMSIVNGTNSVATVTVDVLPVNSTGASLNADANASQDISKFRIQETSSNEDVKLYGLTLWNNGNASATDYKDVQLVDSAGNILATAQPNGQNVQFVLTAPYSITKGQTKDFWVRAKIVAGASRTIQFVVYNDYDIDVRGVTTSAGLLPTAAGAIDTTFPIGDTTSVYNKVTVASGSFVFTRASDSSSTAVTPGATGVVLAKYIAKPIGESMELRAISFGLDQNAGSVNLTGTVYVKVNGAIVFSAAANTTNFPAAGTASSRSLSSYPILNAGAENTIEVVADVSSSATSSDSYFVNDFDITSVKRLLTNDITDPSVSAIDGYTRAVQSAKINVTTLSTPVATSVVAGTNGVELANFQFDATSSGEDVRISSITVTDTLGSGVDYSGIANLTLKDATGNVLTTTSSTSVNANTVTFNLSNPVYVTRTTPVTLKLYGDVISATGVSHTFKIADENVTATGKDTGNSITLANQVGTGSGQAMTVVAAGTLTSSVLSGTNATPSVARNVNIGSQDVTAFAFRLNSQYEAQKVTTLTLKAIANAGIRATRTVAVGAVPADEEDVTIGQCVIEFETTTGSEDSDCSDDAAEINRTTNNTAALIATAMRAITGANDANGNIAFSGTGANVIATHAAVAAAAVAFTDNTTGDISSTSTTTGVVATGTLKVTDLANIELYAQSGNGTMTLFATAPQFASCTSNVCTYTWTSADNLLPSGMTVSPNTPVNVYTKADVQSPGIATLGDSFSMTLSSDGTDLIAKGVTTASAPAYAGAVVNNNGVVTNIVPFDVNVVGTYPTADTSLTVAAGTQLARFKIMNYGSAAVTITDVKLSDNGAHTATDWTYNLYSSNENGNTYLSTLVDNDGTDNSANVVDFGSLDSSFTISGGSYKYITVYLSAGTVATGDNVAFGVAALGDIDYSVAETDLGYDGNVDGDTQDTITGLPTSGLPVNASFSAL